MQVVDPDYRLPMVDVRDPALSGQLERVRRDERGWICGNLGKMTLRYRRSRPKGVCVDLEIRDRRTGRRLRQDASASDDLFNRLLSICFASRPARADRR